MEVLGATLEGMASLMGRVEEELLKEKVEVERSEGRMKEERLEGRVELGEDHR